MTSYSIREVRRKYRLTNLPSTPLVGTSSCSIGLKRPERHLITVGIGHPYDEAAHRLARQASATGWFDVVHVVNGQDDKLGAAQLLKSLAPLRRLYPKGAGLWSWKPSLLRLALAAAPDNAHVYYIDAGCELSRFGSARFKQLDLLLAERSVLIFHLPFREDEWTKPCLLDRFSRARNSAQIQATWLGVRKDPTGEALITRWDECCREQDFKWLKDPVSDNLLPAKEHRHDQSVLSCIIKAEFSHLKSEPWEDFYAPWLYHTNSEVLLAPVHALRTRDGRSKLDPLINSSSYLVCVKNRNRKFSIGLRARRALLRLYHGMLDEFFILVGEINSIMMKKKSKSNSARTSS